MSWTSLEDYCESHQAEASELPRWAHRSSVDLSAQAEQYRPQIERALHAFMSIQYGEWLESGLLLGPEAWGDAHQELLAACTTLTISPVPAIVRPCALRNQRALGTDSQAVMQVSSWFLADSSPEEQRFVFGRLAGHLRCRQVTWSTLYDVLTNHSGLRFFASSAVPLPWLLRAPLSLGARLVSARWQRTAEINADRAGLIACGSLEAARQALLREALGVRAEIDVDAFLASPSGDEHRRAGRLGELWADRPWLRHRLQALDLFVRSAAWSQASGEAVLHPLSDDVLARETHALLEVR